MPSVSARGTSLPSSRVIRAGRSASSRGGCGCGYTSTVPGTMRAPQSSTISRAASRWAAIAWSGCSCFSKRADASLRSPSAFELRMMFGPTQVAASISTRVVPSETSETCPPMIPAIPLGPSASQTSAISGSKLALDVVERDHPLALGRAANDDLRAAHPVEVERVQRLGGREHHVVGDVDDVRDRPLAGRHQPLLEPQRRRADLHVLEHARGEAQADLGVDLDRHVVLGAVVAARLGVLVGRVRRQRRPR